ncbi:MAG TPA: hypothetical protein VHS54_07515 [Jatrophihabitans sp.]|nr:hypothetical protein [Jatrophihabitans sp.]
MHNYRKPAPQNEQAMILMSALLRLAASVFAASKSAALNFTMVSATAKLASNEMSRCEAWLTLPQSPTG